MTLHQFLISFSDVKEILAMGVGIRDPYSGRNKGPKKLVKNNWRLPTLTNFTFGQFFLWNGANNDNIRFPRV